MIRHDHDGLGHEHPPIAQGLFHGREKPLHRDYGKRAFTIGIGWPLGSGKTPSF